MMAIWNGVGWLLRSDKFWSVFGTFLGALPGIPAGFYLNHLWSRRVDRERRRQLMDALSQSVDKNLHLVKQIEIWLTDSSTPYYAGMDLTLLDSTASLKYELIGDIALCRRIDHLRYEIGRLARKLDGLINVELNPSTGASHTQLRTKLVEAIKGEDFAALKKILDDMRAELVRA
jgi:hypothetical protein